MSYQNYELALKFLYKAEGGYSNNPYDMGGVTNLGVTQSAYNSYRKRHGLQYKDVRYITREESKRLYYEDYWLTSGADKINDKQMAVLLFDTAVLHGPGRAKEFYVQSGGDIDKFLAIRRKSYDGIVARYPSQSRFYDGWVNRVNKLKSYLNDIDSTEISTQDEAEFTILLKGGVETSDIEEEQKENKSKDIIDSFINDEKLDFNSNENGCTGKYWVSAYQRSDGTKVSGYVRTCSKHSGGNSVPKLHLLPKDEMEKWIRDLI